MSRAVAPRSTPQAALRPFIKWPGGKSAELKQIRARLPHNPGAVFRRYYEPFCGGAALYFALLPECEARLNDASGDLVGVYRHTQTRSAEFVTRLKELAAFWASLGDVAGSLQPWFNGAFTDRDAETPVAEEVPISGSIRALLQREAGASTLESRLARSIADKIRRVRRLEDKHAMRFSADKLAEHCETAVRSAFYMHLRDEIPPADDARRSAEFFFVREFCYGAMFRYGPKGNFNIPYGGIAYNRKDLQRKIDYLLSNELGAALKRCTISNRDFEAELAPADGNGPGADDFIFLDPPYDSEFKNYGPISFGRADQQRLAETLSGLASHWMLVIKETPLIRGLYESMAQGNPDITISRFDNRYTYNVRGRNQREVVHLVVSHRLQQWDQTRG